MEGGKSELARLIDIPARIRGRFSQIFFGLGNFGGAVFWRGLVQKKVGVAMSDALFGTQADWIAVWRAEMAAQGLTYREVDDLAGLGEGYMAKLMCGLVKEATAATIAKINRALGIRFVMVAGEREALTP